MNYCLIYFGIVLFILVAKFVLALLTIGKLKSFIVNYRPIIEQYTYKNHKLYFNLFMLHLTRSSYGKDYVRSMIIDIRRYWNITDWLLIFLFAIFWPISIPIYLVLLLIDFFINLVNNILGNVLDENSSFEYQEEYY